MLDCFSEMMFVIAFVSYVTKAVYVVCGNAWLLRVPQLRVIMY